MKGALPLGLRPHPGIFLSRRSCGFGLLFLAACGGGADRGAPLNPGLPGEVVARVPLGVSLDAISRDVNGCFFYTQNGAVFIVKDAAGGPICL